MMYQCQNPECKKTFIHPSKLITNPANHDFLETYVCPHCKTITYTEYTPPQEEITSVKSVPLEECDSWIAKGYKVKELYAKTATMVKLEAQA